MDWSGLPGGLGGLFALEALLTPRAESVDVEGKELGLERGVFQRAKFGHKLRITYGAHSPARSAYQMQMAFRPPLGHAFILRGLVAELMAAYQACLQKELHGGVDRRQAQVHPVERQRLVECVDVEMCVGRKYLLQYGIAFGCTPHAVGFEILVESCLGRKKQFVGRIGGIVFRVAFHRSAKIAKFCYPTALRRQKNPPEPAKASGGDCKLGFWLFPDYSRLNLINPDLS